MQYYRFETANFGTNGQRFMPVIPANIYRRTYNVTALFDNVFTILEYIDSCETSSPIIYKKGRKGNDIKSGTAEYT